MQPEKFLTAFEESLATGIFARVSLANYKGNEPDLKKVQAKRTMIRQQDHLSFTYTYKTRDIVKNFSLAEGADKIRQLVTADFQAATLFTTEFDMTLENIEGRKAILKKLPASNKEAQSTEHNRNKQRLIAAKGRAYLHDLKVTDAKGHVLSSAQDKFRQINKYVEILSSALKDVPAQESLKIVDMGSGKGYLTFALYDYLVNVAQMKARVTGVEFRPDLAELCNKIAAKSKFDALDFVQGKIETFDATGTNVLIALHACDTATDDAIYKGITAAADLIVVAPCCHKQIRREMERHKAKNQLDFLTKYGTFTERQAEMVTDGLRGLILEYFGYSVKIFEFISDEHTAKNVIIVATRKSGGRSKDPAILSEIHRIKDYFGLSYHHLARLAGIDKPANNGN